MPQMNDAQIEGFRQGYNHVVAVLELACNHHTHMNPHVRMVLNQAFTATVHILRQQLENTIQETFNAKFSKPSK